QGLADQAEVNWATPKSEERNQQNSGDEYAAVSHQATNWPTAASRDHKGKPKGTHRSDGKPHTDDQLDRAAESFPCSLPDGPTTDAGLNSLLAVWTRPSCPRLSPAMQWWLLGMPHPQAIFYGLEET